MLKSIKIFQSYDQKCAAAFFSGSQCTFVKWHLGKFCCFSCKKAFLITLCGVLCDSFVFSCSMIIVFTVNALFLPLVFFYCRKLRHCFKEIKVNVPPRVRLLCYFCFKSLVTHWINSMNYRDFVDCKWFVNFLLQFACQKCEFSFI